MTTDDGHQRLDPSSITNYQLLITLSSSWLHEPPSRELAAAYADVLLLNVYPYGTAFTDELGELNAPGAQLAARRYAAHGYHPAELFEVGAPDHLGLGLGFLAHLAQSGQTAAFEAAAAELLEWAPIVCLAVERQPGVDEFYRSLAVQTAEVLFAAVPADSQALVSWAEAALLELAPPAAEDDEVRLRDVLNFLLVPARSGVFLSRARLAQLAWDLDLPMPFGGRFDLARGLFEAAGGSGKLERLLQALTAEWRAWADRYHARIGQHPAWAPAGHAWLRRAEVGLAQLADMLRTAAAEAI